MFFRHYASSYGLLNYPSLWNSCHIALIWFLPRMYFEMTCKITIPWKGLVTLTAVICSYLEYILLLSRMHFQMTCKITIPWKKASHIDYIDMLYFNSECFSNISKMTICWNAFSNDLKNYYSLKKKVGLIDYIDMLFFLIQNVLQIFRKLQFVENAIQY